MPHRCAAAVMSLAPSSALGHCVEVGNKDALRARLILTKRARALVEGWEKGQREVPRESLKEVERGVFVGALVFFSGCTPDAKGACNVTMDVTARDPRGGVYGEMRSAELWAHRPPPPSSALALGVQFMGIVIEPHDPAGDYVIEVALRDRNAGTSLTLSESFRVAERPRSRRQRPRPLSPRRSASKALALPEAAETLRYEAYTLDPNGGRMTLKAGERQYSPARDVDVVARAEPNHWSKDLLLFGNYELAADVYREPAVDGFGLVIQQRDNSKSFSWNWFDRKNGNTFVQRQGPGRVAVVLAKVDGLVELAAMEFLEEACFGKAMVRGVESEGRNPV